MPNSAGRMVFDVCNKCGCPIQPTGTTLGLCPGCQTDLRPAGTHHVVSMSVPEGRALYKKFYPKGVTAR